MSAGSDPVATGPSPDRPGPTPSAAPPRSGAGLMVLAATGFLALSLMYMESVRLPAVAGRVVADLAFLIPLFLSVGLCITAYRRSRGVEARFWLLGASLNSVLLVSEVYWLSFIVYGGGPPPPIYAPFQVLHLAAAFLFLAMLATMARFADTPAPMQVRWWFDLAAVAAVIYVVVLRFFVDSLFAGVAEATPAAHLIAVVYTTWGLMMLAGGIWILVRAGLMRWRAWERLIALSLMIYAAGIVTWPIWFVAFRDGGSVDERSVLDLVLVLGHYLFVLAAVQRLMRPGQAWPMRRLGPAKRVSGRTVTYLVLGLSIVALPLLVVAAVLAPRGTLDRAVYAVAAAVIAVLMAGRTIVSALENGRLFHTSVSDPLTGLYNHAYFHERLAADVAGAQRYNEPVAVLWFDIDDFTRLNRLAGQGAGDQLLRAVAAALTSVSGDAVVCRVGGDEFAVIARGADAAAAEAIGRRLEEALAASVSGAAPPSVSGGIATSPLDSEDPLTLAGMAERTAMWARHRGKGRVLLYDADKVGESVDTDEGLQEIEERSRLGTLQALAAAVDARREASGTRSAAVAALSGALSRQLGLDEERVRLIEVAALVHDVGMVSLSDDMLAKPEALTAQELEAMRRHPALGEQIVGASAPAVVVPWIRHHHERWDGEGYPDGLRAVAIPLESRIIAVCDAWDAMISERPWRRAMTATEAVTELRACAGTQFDPELVEPLIKLVEAFHRL